MASHELSIRSVSAGGLSPRGRRFLVLIILVLAVLGSAHPVRAARVPLFPLSGPADEGSYRLYVNEEPVVTSQFTWKSDGSFSADNVMSLAGQSVKTSLEIEVDPQGGWIGIRMETPAGPVNVAREDSVARITFKDKTSTVNLKPGTILFENFTPALMALAVRSYDQTRNGKQSFPLFILPQVVMDASLELQGTVERTVAGRDLKLTRYLYSLPGVDVHLLVDEQGRVVLADVPSQHAAYVREGYESLRRPAESDSLLSKPAFDVEVESGVSVPMRDGVKLATDIYRPKADGRFPVILVRTPYKKEMDELQARFYARRGYVFAVQDCRGRFSSPGTWEPFIHEAADGYDAVEWLASQPWSTGKVGMIGASYLGWVQWWAARDRPPHLTTIIPNVSPPDPYFNIPYEYGAFFMFGAIWWADILESKATGDISGEAFREVNEKKYGQLLRGLPVIDLDKKVLGKKNPYWRTWIAHPDNDDYWQPADFLDRLGGVDIPVFHQSGWFDGDGIGSKLNYLKMVADGHHEQKLVLGPWGHTDTAMRRIGDRDFGENAIVDLQRDYLRWLDHWLKGTDNGIDKEPLVSIFVMGSNRWLHGDVYPLPETQMTRYYLVSGGHANTSRGDGRLSTDLPPADAPPDRYTYDPGDPTPYPGFYVSPEDRAGSKTDRNKDRDKDRKKEEATSVEQKHQEEQAYYGQVDSTRSDILVYDTPVLTQPLTFAGPLSAVLYASSSAKDTDWFMRVSEIDSTGVVFQLTEGKIRARYRKSFSQPELLTPGSIEEYRLDLWQTGITIEPGQKLRIEVASASFPLFSRNLNTGGHNETEKDFVKADQVIYHEAGHPSYVLLPVLELEGAARTGSSGK